MGGWYIKTARRCSLVSFCFLFTTPNKNLSSSKFKAQYPSPINPPPTMSPFTRSHNPHHQTVTTTTTTTTNNNPQTTTTKPTIMQRLKGSGSNSHTTKQHAVKPQRVHKAKAARSNGVTKNGVPRRKTSIGDKVSGLVMKMKGSVTHRPGEKAAGTRRMHGTDGRGARRVY